MKRKLILGFCALYLVGFVAWGISGALSGDRLAPLTLLLALPGGLLLGAISTCLHFKRAFVDFYAPNTRHPARPGEFPALQVAELEQLTREWEQLGFVLCRDQALIAGTGMGTVFSRSFEHPTQGAVAAVTQQITPLKTLPWMATVSTCWGEREPVFRAARSVEDKVAPLALPTHVSSNEVAPDLQETLWIFMTHTHAPNKFWRLMRQKRLMSERLAPASSPQELWHAHQERRALLESRLKELHLTGELLPLLDAHGLVLSARLWRGLKRTPAWKFGLAAASRAPIPERYDGELTA